MARGVDDGLALGRWGRGGEVEGKGGEVGLVAGGDRGLDHGEPEVDGGLGVVLAGEDG